MKIEISKKLPRRTNHAVMLYMQEVGARAAAQSGIASDQYHLGKLILQGLRDDPDFVLQIDGSTHSSESNGSVLERSIRCALALKELGLQTGDVMVLMAPNHLDLTIPFYAALYLGILIAGVDTSLGQTELTASFEVNKPKIVFCQSDKASDVKVALERSNTVAHIITFGGGTQHTSFVDFIGNAVSEKVIQEFKATDFNTEETVAFLTATSGTTGLPKSAALTHKNLTLGLPQFICRFYNYPTPTRLYFFASPLQWLSAGLAYTMSAIMKYTRLQISAPVSREHIYDVINHYKPSATFMSPNLITTVLSGDARERCEFSSLEVIFLAGSQVTQSHLDNIKLVAPQAEVDIGYGISETSGIVLSWDPEVPIEYSGRPMGYLRHRLVDVSTLEDINEPNVVGELWVKGPTVFKGYYNNPEVTKEAFSEDGWFKTGDLFCKDEHANYMFVDRLKLLLKYRNHQISPAELEQVIRTHPGVHDAVVVGVPDAECGDLAAAAVVRRHGAKVTAQEVKDWVKEHLSDSKHLRGGVVFMNELPMTVTTKVDRMKLKKIVPLMQRE